MSRNEQIYWNPAYEILYLHILDQSNASARFTWHRDTEEDTHKMRAHYSTVLLLQGDPAQVAALRVAGAPQKARYMKASTGHIFDSALFHTTEVRADAAGLKLGVFVGLYI